MTARTLYDQDRARAHALRAVEMRPVRGVYRLEDRRLELPQEANRILSAAVLGAFLFVVSCVGGGIAAVMWIRGGM